MLADIDTAAARRELRSRLCSVTAPTTHLGRIFVGHLAHKGFTSSGVGACDKPGAVHSRPSLLLFHNLLTQIIDITLRLVRLPSIS